MNDKEELPEFVTLNHLIPLEDESTLGDFKSLIIGHNMAFDRQFIREQYLEKESAMKCLLKFICYLFIFAHNCPQVLSAKHFK